MFLAEREINVPAAKGSSSLLSYFEKAVAKQLSSDQIPVRFAVTQSNSDGYHCELGVLKGTNELSIPRPVSIFGGFNSQVQLRQILFSYPVNFFCS